MGLTVSGTVRIESSSLALGNVVAFSRAEIYKKFFDGGWVNLTELQARFPSRVRIDNSMVSFVGPVAIISHAAIGKSPMLLVPVFIFALSGIALAALVAHSTAHRSARKLIIGSIACATAVVILINSYAIYQLRIQPGIYFW